MMGNELIQECAVQDPIIPALTRRQTGMLGYVLAPVLIAAMTAVLLHLQETIERYDHIHSPIAFWFAFPVLVISLLGGRGPGFFALALSEIALLFFLEGHGQVGEANSVSSILRYTGLPLICLTEIVGMEALRRNTALLMISEAAQARTRAVMDSAPVGIAIVSPSKSVQFANSEFLQIWNLANTDNLCDVLQGFSIADENGHYLAFNETPFGRVLNASLISDQQELIVELPSGDAVWIDQRARMVSDQKGRPLGTLLIASNISERKLAELSALRATQREAVIAKITSAISNAEAPEAIQQTAASALCTTLGVDRCCFAHFAISENTVTVVPDYSRAGIKSVAGTYQIEDKAKFVANDTDFPSPFVIENIEKEAVSAGLQNLLYLLDLSSAIIATIDSNTAGRSLLVVGSYNSRQWTNDEVSLVGIISSQVRHASISAVSRLREHKIATILQEALQPSLPHSIPGLEIHYHYEPALEEAVVGGDFVDIFNTDPNPESSKWAIVIGDIAGKGLAAASQVATVRTMLRYALTRGDEMATVIAHLSDTLASREWIVGFATMFVAVFDPKSMVLEYVSCGHESGLLRRIETGLVEELSSSGMALGATVGGLFEAKRVHLNVGDTLFLYTDGVSEVGPDRASMLGSDGLKELLAACEIVSTPEEIVKSLRCGIGEYSGGPLRDDVCMLALKVVNQALPSEPAVDKVHSNLNGIKSEAIA